MELYDQKINEFIDWLSGKHYHTQKNITNGQKVSGGSIRALLQERLRNPIFIPDSKNTTGYVDDGYWRIFSSKDAYDLWVTDRQAYAALELAKFPKQSEYEFVITGLENNLRYIIEGNSQQTNSILTYTWEIKKGTNTQNDAIRVTYNIHNTTTGKTQTFSHLFENSQRDISFNLYEYLDRGENQININFEGISTGATGGTYLVINMIQFDIEATWDYTALHPQERSLIINNYKVNRNNTDADVTVFITIDGTQVLTKEYNKGNSNIQETALEIPWDDRIMIPSQDGVPVYHNLQIWATTSYNNTIFTSNILYFEFEIQADSSLNNIFLNLNTSIDSEGLSSIPVISPRFAADQFIPVAIKYGYNTDNLSINSQVEITWRLIKESSNESQELGTFTIDKYTESTLNFIPSLATDSNKQIYLIAIFDEEEIKRVPIYITPGKGFIEQGGYIFKLSAYGRRNDSSGNQEWTYGTGGNKIETEFSKGVTWDDNRGWYENSFRTVGLDSYATIKYAPLLDTSSGKTIEIDFETEKINNTNDVIILIGNARGARIEITPNRATLFNSANVAIVETNFKTNERLHLTFIINTVNGVAGANNANLAYIVNNGILERAAGISGSLTSDGIIKLGGSRSGVRIYSVRVYNYPITYKNAFDNYEFDATDKIAVKQKNKVLNESTNTIDYKLCCAKIDTILIEGDLSKLLKLTTNKDDSTTDVTISRVCPYDKSKDFKCVNAQIRKHGQSTLNYPVPSMKFWFNKSKSGITPVFTCTGQEDLGLNKNRYKMKDHSIPSNKFILQANYSDSSGVHNGGLQRLINDSWYNAIIDKEYKLRSLPQLFASNTTVSPTDNNLHTELDPNKDLTTGRNGDGKLWRDYAGDKQFPYIYMDSNNKMHNGLQIGPDSFPCIVFYSDTSSGGEQTFLGLYVFMEDKKADYIYGERSMYYYNGGDFNIADDPFVLKYENSKNGAHAIELPNGNKQALDSDENRIWDNDNVLRIEGLTINTLFSSFMSYKDASNRSFDDVIVTDAETNARQYRWEQDFEMIYPDPDDIEGKIDEATGRDTTKFGADSKFRRTAQPWVDFFRWVTDTYQNQERFQAEAAQHFDIYKMAAYYIIFLRFGLVDSVERNAQWKTYDGIHWHCEPWDMDIALGNMNTGGIAFDPPIDRNSTFKTDAGTYAYSGKSLTTSNWIWDAFEAWPYWMNILVPKVSQALYDAGLTYNNVIKMFDDEYQNKWCEILYNESMNYKYILSRGSDNGWLGWLQGSRTTHRHWWLSTSMNTYDAIWNCGDYKSHRIIIFANKDQNATGSVKEYLTVGVNSDIYINVTYQDSAIRNSPQKVTVAAPYKFDITDMALSNKVEFVIYGAAFISTLDMSSFASGIVNLILDGAYEDTLGAPLKTLNIGCPYTESINYIEGSYNGILRQLSVGNALDNIETLNISGHIFNDLTDIIETQIYRNNKTTLKNFYARGTSITSFSSSKSGNDFNILELPGRTYDPNTVGTAKIDYQFTVLRLYNSTWNRIVWYDGEITAASTSTINEETGEEEIQLGTISYTQTNIDGNALYNIPWSLNTVEFHGSTAKSENAKKFVLNWILCIQRYLEHEIELHNIGPGWVGTEYEDCADLDEMLYYELNKRTLIIDGIRWDQYDANSNPNGTCENCLTFRDLELISKFNGGNNNPDKNATGQTTFKGYIEISRYESELSVEQLTQLKEWFGESIFSLKSSGLVIDQALDYVKINVGGKAYTKLNESTGELEINLDESNDELNAATLSATRFQLQENNSSITWAMRAPGTNNAGSTSFSGCMIKKGADGVVRLIAQETTLGNRDIEVMCVMDGNEPSYVTIHIKAVMYPEDITIGIDQTNMPKLNGEKISLRSFKGAHVFWTTGMIAEFYPQITWNDDGSDEAIKNRAKIRSITYKIIDGATNRQLLNVTSNNLTGGDETPILIDGTDYLKYIRNAEKGRNGMVFTCETPTNDDYFEYKLEIQIMYISGSYKTLETKLIVIDDAVQIVTTTAGVLYNVLRDHYLVSNGYEFGNNPFYRADLISLNGTITFRNTRNYSEITDILTVPSDPRLNEVSVFRYMPNIEGIDLSGCININVVKGTSTTNAVMELDVTKCPKLKLLNMNGCTNFGKDIDVSVFSRYMKVDLSNNPLIENVDLRGTYVDVTLPTSASKMVSLKLGHPTSVTLTNQNNLTSSNVSVEDPNNITAISLTTDSTAKNDLFKTFANIIQNIE